MRALEAVTACLLRIWRERFRPGPHRDTHRREGQIICVCRILKTPDERDQTGHPDRPYQDGVGESRGERGRLLGLIQERTVKADDVTTMLRI